MSNLKHNWISHENKASQVYIQQILEGKKRTNKKKERNTA
jgi:hypothetical protein